jgi:flagellin
MDDAPSEAVIVPAGPDFAQYRSSHSHFIRRGQLLRTRSISSSTYTSPFRAAWRAGWTALGFIEGPDRTLSFSIRNNVVSRIATGRLSATQQDLSHRLNRVASGRRITKAGDDAAGAAVGFNLSTRARSVRQAVRNANDGLSIMAVAEQANVNLSDRLSRMRELAVQSANGTLTDDDRDIISKEFVKHQNDIKNISVRTEFNGKQLMIGGTIDVQVGHGGDNEDRVSIALPQHNTVYVNLRSLTIETQDEAKSFITSVDAEIDRVNQFASNLGANTNRLTSAIRTATAHELSLEKAASQIQDADYAFETAAMTALQVRSQAGAAAIAQANGMAQSVVSLIG